MASGVPTAASAIGSSSASDIRVFAGATGSGMICSGTCAGGGRPDSGSVDSISVGARCTRYSAQNTSPRYASIHAPM